MTVHLSTPDVTLYHGDCIEVMAAMPENSIDAIVTDPPYGLGFMGKKWDDLPPGADFADQAFRVLKPGGHMLAFGGTRTWHRLAVAVEDAGFEIRDSIAWLYGSGFPKSMDVAKAITAHETTGSSSRTANRRAMTGNDSRSTSFGSAGTLASMLTAPTSPPPKANLTENAKAWDGWGTALKPAFEPIVIVRKPLSGTVAANVLEYGTGALNIDASRIGERFPANVVLDETQAGELDKLSDASRFFYVAKAPKRERPNVDGIAHPTVKPLALIRYLVLLVTPAGGIVLDPFAGSGTTLEAATAEGFQAVGIEREQDYLPLIEQRLQRN